MRTKQASGQEQELRIAFFSRRFLHRIFEIPGSASAEKAARFPRKSLRRIVAPTLGRMNAPFHLHPLNFSLDDLSALSSAELSLVLFHPAATDDLNRKVFRVFSRKREAARIAKEPLSPLDFSLDDVGSLSSEELAIVASRFHTFAEKGEQEQAEELWFKRRETDFGFGLKWRDVPSTAAIIPRLPTPPVIPQIPPYPSPDDPLPPDASKLLFTLRLSHLPVKIITTPDILLSFLPTDAKSLLAAVVDPPGPEDPEFTTCAFAAYPTANAQILAFQSIVGLIIHRFDVGVDFVESEKAVQVERFFGRDWKEAVSSVARIIRAGGGGGAGSDRHARRHPRSRIGAHERRPSTDATENLRRQPQSTIHPRRYRQPLLPNDHQVRSDTSDAIQGRSRSRSIRSRRAQKCPGLPTNRTECASRLRHVSGSGRRDHSAASRSEDWEISFRQCETEYLELVEHAVEGRTVGEAES